MGTSSQKRSEISFLRIIATFAIVLLHTGSAIADNRTNYSLSLDQLYFFECVRNTMQWGVPVFYMISGALLLSSKRKVTLKTVFIYVLRMTAVLFLFGVPFAMMEILFADRQISVKLLFTAIRYVLEGKSWSHLWYLYSIIGIYLILPFLKCFTENCERKVMEYVLVLLFVFTNCLPLASKLMDLNIEFHIPMNSAVFYVLLGKYLDDYYLDVLKDRKKSILLLGFASGLVLLVTRYTLGYSTAYINNSSPLVTLQAIAIFSLGLQCTTKNAPPPHDFVENRQAMLWRIFGTSLSDQHSV